MSCWVYKIGILRKSRKQTNVTFDCTESQILHTYTHKTLVGSWGIVSLGTGTFVALS